MMNAVWTANLGDATTSGVLAEDVDAMGNVERSSSGDLAGDLFHHVSQNWNCSQVENELEERCDGLADG